ncbi:MAG: phosphoserine phosphatase, partial [Deltaproteobacteria bacterium]|nr:phosphoserine phosphatase [Deltaproteobacteria bacterium]
CANRIFTYFNADPEAMVRLMETIEIDEGFPCFLDACTRAKDRVHVLSDGFDLCIRTVFGKHGIDIPFYANRLIYENGFTMECPHANLECGHCGVCKTTLMGRLKVPSHRSVYIGDGYSDACPARHADMVFAKEPLHTLCREGGVDARRFASFDEIVERLYGAP